MLDDLLGKFMISGEYWNPKFAIMIFYKYPQWLSQRQPCHWNEHSDTNLTLLRQILFLHYSPENQKDHITS